MNTPRVAFFADSFREVNGVAHTCRTLTALAERYQCPFFVVHGGAENQITISGSVTRCELRRGPASFAVDRDFRYDLLFYRHRAEVERRLRAFAPDVLHITGPGDAGTLGVVVAKALGVPICASWHTNLHEYAGRRLEKVTPFLPGRLRRGLGRVAELGSMRALGYFYQLADSVMAPNRELLDLLAGFCDRPGFPMRRGVDTTLFTPARRRRTDNALTIGYVGRLTIEKNVYFLREIEAALIAAGITNYRFLIVGDGIEKERLAREMKRAVLPGVLLGEALAEAYANMDIFVFPSRTDTFGNVVLEALASGVPAVVTADGGPKFIVRSGETGFIADSGSAFIQFVVELAQDRALVGRMSIAARRQGTETGWDAVWEEMQTAWRATSLKFVRAPDDMPEEANDDTDPDTAGGRERSAAHSLAYARRGGHARPHG
ncbi:MAG: glycosyltransferase [Bryobacteraceae bacterium]